MMIEDIVFDNKDEGQEDTDYLSSAVLASQDVSALNWTFVF